MYISQVNMIKQWVALLACSQKFLASSLGLHGLLHGGCMSVRLLGLTNLPLIENKSVHDC